MYMVVRKDQLKEHHLLESATREAVRLAESHGAEFYVVEPQFVARRSTKVTIQPMETTTEGVDTAVLLVELLGCDHSRVGEPWTPTEDELLVSLWNQGNTCIESLAEIFMRNPNGIYYRLRKHDIYPVY